MLITFPQSLRCLGSMFEFIFSYVLTNSCLNPGGGHGIGLGPSELKRKSKCCGAGKPSREGAWLNPARAELSHQLADSGDDSRGAQSPNFWWPCSPGRLSIAMPANYASIHPRPPQTPSVPNLILTPTKSFLFLFFLLLAPVFCLFSMPCLCTYIQGSYLFVDVFL